MLSAPATSVAPQLAVAVDQAAQPAVPPVAPRFRDPRRKSNRTPALATAVPAAGAGRRGEQVREVDGADRAPSPAQVAVQLPLAPSVDRHDVVDPGGLVRVELRCEDPLAVRSEEHTSELQ